jgi:hypothetical protein
MGEDYPLVENPLVIINKKEKTGLKSGFFHTLRRVNNVSCLRVLGVPCLP